MRRRGQARVAGMALGVLMAVIAPSQAAELQLPVPAVTIYPGDVIEGEQLSNRAFIAHTVARSTVYDTRDAIIGKVARRTLLPGQPIPVNALRDAYLVVQGKTALVIFEAGGLTITLQATALQNGGAGDTVSLRNNDSGTTITGTVAPDGTVRLGAL